MSDYKTILVAREGAVATITLNRPDKLNAINAELIADLTDCIAVLERDASLIAAIITGSGEKAFAAGADISAMVAMSTAEARAFSDAGHVLGARMEQAHFPIIGAVNGFALGGGCELAMACDFLYASTKAKFGQPEVNLGVTPGFGGTQRLARRVGVGRARELLFTGDVIGADEALRIGLVNAVVAPEELLPRVKKIAENIATKGPLAVAACKRVLLRGQDVPLPSACEIEVQAFSSLFGTRDLKEGMAAFLEKRRADFRGA